MINIKKLNVQEKIKLFKELYSLVKMLTLKFEHLKEVDRIDGLIKYL